MFHEECSNSSTTTVAFLNIIANAAGNPVPPHLRTMHHIFFTAFSLLSFLLQAKLLLLLIKVLVLLTLCYAFTTI